MPQGVPSPRKCPPTPRLGRRTGARESSARIRVPRCGGSAIVLIELPVTVGCISAADLCLLAPPPLSPPDGGPSHCSGGQCNEGNRSCAHALAVCPERRFRQRLLGVRHARYIQKRYRARISINLNPLAWADAPGGNAGPKDGGDVVLAGYDGAVTQRPADIGDYRGGHGEKRRPCRGGDACHQHLSRLHLAEVLRARENAGRGCDLATAGCNTIDRVASLLLGCRRHKTLEELEPGSPGE